MVIEHKGYRIGGDGTYGMKLIQAIGKGALPKKLRGRFTNFTSAKKSIDLYVGTKGVRKNDEAISTG